MVMPTLGNLLVKKTCASMSGTTFRPSVTTVCFFRKNSRSSKLDTNPVLLSKLRCNHVSAATVSVWGYTYISIASLDQRVSSSSNLGSASLEQHGSATCQDRVEVRPKDFEAYVRCACPVAEFKARRMDNARVREDI